MTKPGFVPVPDDNKTKLCIDCVHSKVYPDKDLRPKHHRICVRPIENLVTRDVLQAYTDCNSERTAIPEDKDPIDLCGKEAKYYQPKEIK